MNYTGTTTLTAEQLADWDDEQLELAGQVLREEQDAIRAERRKLNTAREIKAARAKVAALTAPEIDALAVALGRTAAE